VVAACWILRFFEGIIVLKEILDQNARNETLENKMAITWLRTHTMENKGAC